MNFQSLEKSGGRPVTSLLALLLIPLFAGLLLAPWVHNALRRHIEDVKFEKVARRCIMLGAVALLVPMVRRSGLGPEIRRAVLWDRAARRQVAMAAGLGFASMAAGYAIGWAAGAYRPEPELAPGPAALACVAFLPGALFVGFFEEVFFRGFVFGAIRARAGAAAAMILSSAFFSAIHFMKPELPGHVDAAPWDAGLRLLPYAMSDFELGRDWAFAATLLLMGWTLGLLYQRRGHLGLCIGLHAGWVLAMLAGNYLLQRNHEVWPVLYGVGGVFARSPAALGLMALFFVWAIRQPRVATDSNRAPALPPCG